MSVRQASLAACSASKAPHFRCNVTAVTPPNRWTDDVVTFFLRFAARENEEKLDELRDQMKQFYGDEENEEKVDRERERQTEREKEREKRLSFSDLNIGVIRTRLWPSLFFSGFVLTWYHHRSLLISV